MREFGYWSKSTPEKSDKIGAGTPAEAPAAVGKSSGTGPRRLVGDFGDWFGRNADETADILDGKPPVAGGEKGNGGYNPDRSLPVPVSSGGGLGNAELVTGTAGTGVRTGDEGCEYDSFRPGGRDFGLSSQGGAARPPGSSGQWDLAGDGEEHEHAHNTLG
ncbi:MAG: hypothetical protein IPH06_02130 [Alphaproteobacteria bacterium]|jgi:hypothetical protein|nr:hypothetical protein [Alphaproteobacteria bacterium]QQS56849.1 MAG: hypothetical protein IPN28_11385 [Alphaproteobacteria bacterium]